MQTATLALIIIILLVSPVIIIKQICVDNKMFLA